MASIAVTGAHGENTTDDPLSVFGVLGAVIGPGYDADACSSAVGGAVIGGFLGWFGWLGVLMLVFGMLGLSLGGHLGEESGAVIGMVVGVASAWFAVYCDRKTAVKGELDNCDMPSHGEPPRDSRST